MVNKMAATEVQVAPVPMTPQRRPERRGGTTQPAVRHYPKVVAGTCEYHGTIDPNTPGQFQYLLCPNDGKHPKWGDLQCSYCEGHKIPEDVNYKATLNIYDHPTNPTDLVVVCDNYECLKKHEARFKVA